MASGDPDCPAIVRLGRLVQFSRRRDAGRGNARTDKLCVISTGRCCCCCYLPTQAGSVLQPSPCSCGYRRHVTFYPKHGIVSRSVSFLLWSPWSVYECGLSTMSDVVPSTTSARSDCQTSGTKHTPRHSEGATVKPAFWDTTSAGFETVYQPKAAETKQALWTVFEQALYYAYIFIHTHISSHTRHYFRHRHHQMMFVWFEVHKSAITTWKPCSL